MASLIATDVSPADLADQALRFYVWATAMRVMQNHDDANDVTQAAFLRALKYLHTFDPELGTPLKKWVACIARRVGRQIIADRNRSKFRRLKFTHASDKERYLLNHPDRREVRPVEAAIQSENVSRVRSAIEALPDRPRAVVQNYYYREVQQCQMADEAGLSKSAINLVHKRALQHLRFALQGGRDCCGHCGNSYPRRGRKTQFCGPVCMHAAQGHRQAVRRAAISRAS